MGASPRLLPIAALVATVVIWASYLVVTRLGVTGKLGWVDLGLLRSGTAALVLLPYTLKNGLFPGKTTRRDIFWIAGFGGFAFVFFLASGLGFAPVADSGVFTPSMLAVWVAIFSAIFVGATYTRMQATGLAMILAGALFLGGGAAMLAAEGEAWKGHLLFLAASASWAAYTVRFRASELTALQATVVMASWATILFLVAALFTGIRIQTLSADQLAIQVAQGVAAGVIANFTFLYAVRTLGAPLSAAAAAFVPVLAALGGQYFLGETVSRMQWSGVLVAAIGVALASGYFGRHLAEK